MKINWLWDSRLSENEVKKILEDENHPKFSIYAERLFSRVNDPKMAFDIIDKLTFCKKWSSIKKRLRKDAWLKDRVAFWQTIYERLYEEMKEKGIKIRHPREEVVPRERMELAQQIKKIRKKLGYTQQDIAKKLGVIQQYISKVENGHENFSIDTLTRIAEVFDRSLVIKLN